MITLFNTITCLHSPLALLIPLTLLNLSLFHTTCHLLTFCSLLIYHLSFPYHHSIAFLHDGNVLYSHHPIQQPPATFLNFNLYFNLNNHMWLVAAISRAVLESECHENRELCLIQQDLLNTWQSV